MSPLAVRIGLGALALLALIALRGKRWAYLAFVLLGLAYFPAQAHFHIHAPKCVQVLPTVQQLVPLLQNYLTIALFAGFYWISWVQLRDANARSLWALVATLLAAVAFEIAEGMTAAVVVPKGVVGAKARAVAAALPTHCRVGDLVPAAAGALGALLLLAIWARLTRKPAYVKLVAKRRKVDVPPPAAPAPLKTMPPRAVVYDPPAYAPPPPPPDFSPGPVRATPPSDAAPTEEVAPRKTAAAARAAIMQRLQAIVARLGDVAILRRVWAIIVGRRRAIAVGAGVVVLGVAAALVIPRLKAPAPVVTAQVDTTEATELPPPPPPRELQSEVVGYYEPSYKFVVFDRRFIRLTLRPSPSVMFARVGTKQEFPCEDSRIGTDQVRLKCTVAPYGVVTVEGRFPTRYATAKLDMPVLTAFITVTNNRGEVQYRARDSFYWHVPD